jgi:hypothetical protein
LVVADLATSSPNKCHTKHQEWPTQLSFVELLRNHVCSRQDFFASFVSFVANLNSECFSSILNDTDGGAYFGWARVNNDSVEPMVMSIGNNPQYGNKEKSAVRFSVLSTWLTYVE